MAHNEQPIEELLTAREVAQRLRVNEATVRRWAQTGVLEGIKLPHGGPREIYRFRKSVIDSILADRKD